MTKSKKAVPTRTEVFEDFMEADEVEATQPAPAQEQVVPQRKAAEAKGVDTSSWFEETERKPRRIAMTFTLDPEVIDLIEKAATKHKLSRSRVIEKIAMRTLT